MKRELEIAFRMEDELDLKYNLLKDHVSNNKMLIKIEAGETKQLYARNKQCVGSREGDLRRNEPQIRLN